MKKQLIILLIVVLVFSGISFGQSQPDQWAKEAIDTIKGLDLLEDEVFTDYQANITRQEFTYLMTALVEYKNNETITINRQPFEDTDDETVLKAATIGIIDGYPNNTFQPNQPIKREAIAKIAIETLEFIGAAYETNINTVAINDLNDISPWAVEYVKIAKINRIINGVGNNIILPQDYLTKQQALMIFYNIMTFENNHEETISLDDQAAVAWLQERLKIAGFYTPVDGIYGPNTEKQLLAFKKSESTLEDNTNYTRQTKQLLQERTDRYLSNNPSDLMVLVNKLYSLPYNYVPKTLVAPEVRTTREIYLRPEAADALAQLFKAAAAAGHELYLTSGYRSYDYQQNLFTRKINQVGFEEGSKVVAIPGESEHQTGLAADITTEGQGFGLTQDFSETQAYEWLINNVYDYGFILRYPEGKSEITGYIFEPWHYRYIGNPDIAKEIMTTNITFDDYINK